MSIRRVPHRIDLIRELPPGTVGVEVGVQRGDFSAEILTTEVNELHLVDPWDVMPIDNPLDPAAIDEGGHESNFQFVKERFKNDRVFIWRCASINAAESFHSKRVIDWVFIDANHLYLFVLADLTAWSQRIADDGCIFCHDYRDDAISQAMKFGVVQAVKDFCAKGEWRIDAITNEEWPTVKLVRV